MRILFILMLSMLTACNSRAENELVNTDASGKAICSNTKYFLVNKIKSANSLSEIEYKKKFGESKLSLYATMGDLYAINNILPEIKNRDISTLSEDFGAALISASAAGNENIIEFIFDYSKNNNVVIARKINNRQKSVLAVAAFCGKDTVIKNLLARGLSPNEVDDQGVDSMMIAIVENNFDIANILIENGYDSCANKTAKGQYVKELAIAQSQIEIARLLKDCGK